MTIPNVPPDVDEQHRIWGANCGPTALAAVLGMSVAAVRPIVEAVQGGKFIGYMNAGHLVDCLRQAGRSSWRTDCGRGEVRWPKTRGLCVLQFDGPWCEPGVPAKARYRYTHIVAAIADGLLIYDCNNDDVWLPRPKWEREVIAGLVSSTKRATGWYTSTSIDVR